VQRRLLLAQPLDVTGARNDITAVGGNDDRLDLGKHVDQERRERGHSVGKQEDGPKVERVGAARDGADLTGRAAYHAPRQQAVGSLSR
jgi:hypothetical protein